MESTNAFNTQTLKALVKESLREVLREERINLCQVKESLREVLREERINLCQLLMPFVSDDEQTEIEASLGSPDDNTELTQQQDAA